MGTYGAGFGREMEKLAGVTEITELDATRLDGVGSPANGTPWLFIKAVEVGQPTVKSSSAEADMVEELVTGEKPAGAKCNALTADGSPCGRAPAPGSNRCHLHQETAQKGDDMDASQLVKRLEDLYPHLPRNSAEQARSGQLVTFHKLRAHAQQGQAAKSLSPQDHDELVKAVQDAERLIKGAIQDGLNGYATPEIAGVLGFGSSGVAGPMVTGTASEQGGGTTGPGNRLDIQGGQSPYTIPASAGMSGGGWPPAGAASSGRSLMQMVLDRTPPAPASLAGTGDSGSVAFQNANGGLSGLTKAQQVALKDVLDAAERYEVAKSEGVPERIRFAAEEFVLARLRAEGVQ